jgi:catechol 2,3-dioxygenase-like lactoylglutathione lyase family enzyme
VRLAKPHFDVGLFTTNEVAMLRFWQHEVGLEFAETLPLGGGVRQHRHEMNGSVLKLNAARDALQGAPPSGYRRLMIARAGLTEVRHLEDPDGNQITLVPPGHHGVAGIAIEMQVRNDSAHDRFFAGAMEFERVDSGSYRCGDSLIFVHQSDQTRRTEPLRAPGFRYLTVQVWDVDEDHGGILRRGGEQGRPPVTLGSTARVSFVRDPDGNWIEVSQRASLTGALPEAQ